MTAPTVTGLRHTCPDGQRPQLLRDPAPVGELATVRCPRCPYTFHPTELDALRATIRAAVR